MTDLLTLQRDIHQNAIDHGFWEGSENANIPTKLMLTVSELGEALEEYRAGKMDLYFQHKLHEGVNVRVDAGDSARYFVPGGPFGDEEIPAEAAIKSSKPEGFGVELADALIRILDLASYLGLDMGALVELKMEYNRGRPHMHGGRRV